MMPVKGARALASGMLVLAAICAAPAISAAQDTGTTTDATTTTTDATTTTAPATPPIADPVTTPSQQGGEGPAADEQDAPAPDPVTTTAESPVPAVSAPTGKAHASASASVTIGDFFFSPASVTVAVGDTVIWRNTGDAPHNATADDGSFRTPDLNKGQSASHTFSSPGTFSYICTIHPNMKGTVRVLSSGSGGGGSSGSSSGGSGTSEASGVASPDAAGDANTLPVTGLAAGALALVGLVLLAGGVLMHGAVRRWLSSL